MKKRKLPQEKREYIEKVTVPRILPFKCTNCKRPEEVGDRVTVRHFGPPGNIQATQGPLCANCSELPPNKVKTRWTEDWW